MKKSSKLILILISLLALLILLIFASPKINRRIQVIKEEKNNQETLLEVKKNNSTSNKINSKNGELPESFYLNVPFICQAPLQTEANWKLHEESCEEAAVLQAYQYETGKMLTKNEANEEILAMIAWQMKNFGTHKDLRDKELIKFITGYYKLKDSEVRRISNATIDDIKKELVKNHPVIVPVTGDILNNPFYPYPGYHMLVVIGYTEDRIITNDNGTKRGQDYSYDVNNFEKAFKDAGSSIFILELEDDLQ